MLETTVSLYEYWADDILHCLIWSQTYKPSRWTQTHVEATNAVVSGSVFPSLSRNCVAGVFPIRRNLIRRNPIRRN